jgi:hypothetical protein
MDVVDYDSDNANPFNTIPEDTDQTVVNHIERFTQNLQVDSPGNFSCEVTVFIKYFQSI